MQDVAVAPTRVSGRTMLATGWLAGLVCGAIEACLLLAVQQFDWNRLGELRPTWLPVLWIAPAVNAVLYSLSAFAVTRFGEWFGHSRPWTLGFGFLCFLSTLSWVMATDRVRLAAALVLAFGVMLSAMRWFGARSVPRAFRDSGVITRATLTVALIAIVFQVGGPLLETYRLVRRPAAPLGSPNILVVVVDSLRADHLSSHGYSRRTTPEIDRLAEGGVQFVNAISTSSWTVPAHCSLLTGELPSHTESLTRPCSARSERLPEVLARIGYRTAAFSANDRMFGRRQGFGLGFHHFEDYFRSLPDSLLRTSLGRVLESRILIRAGLREIPGRWSAEDVTDAALAWLKPGPAPFFAILNYYDVHDPYLPPQAYFEAVGGVGSPPGRINTFVGEYFPNLAPAQLAQEVLAYDAAIRYVDAQIGRLLANLKTQGLMANTLVVITSDHGESFGENGLLHHGGSLYREQIEIPLIFYYPKSISPGLRVSTPVSLADVPATIAGLVPGVSLRFPGISLAREWHPSPGGASAGAISELARQPHEKVRKNPNDSGAIKTIVTRDWQLILHETTGAQLIRRQPGVAPRPPSAAEGQAIVESLRSELLARTRPTHLEPALQ